VDKQRFHTFLIAAMMVTMMHFLVITWLYPPPPPGQDGAAGPLDELVAEVEDVEADAGLDGAHANLANTTSSETEAGGVADEVEATAELPIEEVLEQKVTLGSLAPDSPYRMLVVSDNRGAALARVELNHERYKDIDVTHGYFGSLAWEDADDPGGCRVVVVGAGTPAALAKCETDASLIGLKGREYSTDENGVTTLVTDGDVIIRADGQAIENSAAIQDWLASTSPKQAAKLTVLRETDGGQPRELEYTVQLTRRPLQLIRPEPELRTEDEAPHPLSFLFSLEQIGSESAEFGRDEISGLPSLYQRKWAVSQVEHDDDGTAIGVEFRTRLGPSQLEAIGQNGHLELVKRYRLAPGPLGEGAQTEAAGYIVTMEIEVHNLATEPLNVAYQLCGPTGMVMEGWWYSYKVHPSKFSAAGARDIVWRGDGLPHQLFVGSQIGSYAKDEPSAPGKPLFDSQRAVKLDYVGGDAQYFDVVLMRPETAGTESDVVEDPYLEEENYYYRSALARPVGPVDEERKKRTDVSFRLTSQVVSIEPDKPLRQRFEIFAGPKSPEVLAVHGLNECIVYGWFGQIAKPMVRLLHWFHSWVPNYGLAIIMLTVCVRACMFPMGRKMAKNAQKMQELAPEMKKIAETHKNDAEKRMKSQQDLFKKHGYNPLSGCLPMFLQMPIFIGLYRGLSVDIALRQSPLIPGIAWCSNLAGPDKLFYWRDTLPAFFSNETGWLGPYLNVLPLITGLLFIVQQKLFTPPPTDDQQAMQQKVMKFMMLFMVVIFHKVAAGLCIYFIASSLWGVGERLLLPKSKPASAGDETPPKRGVMAALVGVKDGNGNGASVAEKKKRRKKSRR